MRLPKRGEKGFTLIELLIVVAILGVLAAVVIPNVGRFIGAGEDEAAETEFSNVQTAVIAMMTDNELSELPVPIGTSTNDMSLFPEVTATLDDKGADAAFVLAAGSPAEVPGYLLYGHQLVIDVDGDGVYTALDGDAVRTVNYVATRYTTKYYTVDVYGTITQHDSAGITP